MLTLGVLRISLAIFAITHWAACAWYVVGVAGSPGKSWVTQYLQNPDAFGFVEDTGHKYVFCLYFTLTTMTTIGYGDITPQNYQEVVFSLFLLLTASVVFAGQMGTLSDIISSINIENHRKRQQKLSLSTYMRWRGIPRRLAVSIRHHLLFLWDTNGGHEGYEEELKTRLPPVLRTELCYHVYGQILHGLPFLAWMKDYAVCIKQLASMVQTMFLERGDHVFSVGDEDTQIYVLITGNVWVSRNESLFDGVDQTKKARAGFKIPRHTTQTSVAEITTVLLNSERKSSRRSTVSTCNGSGAQPLDGRRWREGIVKKESLSGSRQRIGMQRLKGFMRPEPEPTGSGVPRLLGDESGNPLFSNKVLSHAEMSLRNRDVTEEWAATVLQRFWRARRQHCVPPGSPLVKVSSCSSPSSSRGGMGSKLSQLQSKSVQGPAYFGESCLWLPPADWDTSPAPLYMYAARCTSRCEFMLIPRQSIAILLDRYTPWLPARFEHYRMDVVDSMLRPDLASSSSGGRSRMRLDESSLSDDATDHLLKRSGMAEESNGESTLRWEGGDSLMSTTLSNDGSQSIPLGEDDTLVTDPPPPLLAHSALPPMLPEAFRHGIDRNPVARANAPRGASKPRLLVGGGALASDASAT